MARHPEYQYLDLMAHLLEHGDRRIDRTGVGTLSGLGAMMRFDLSTGQIPIFTTKRVYWKLAVKEMLWFLTGDTNIRNLLKENVRIWTDWPLAKYRKVTGEDIDQPAFEKRVLEDEAFALQWGDLGPVYGKQWRQWRDAEGRVHDQLAAVINDLKSNPSSRRMIFHAWNVGELADMALHPCHMVYQFHVSNISAEGGRRPRLSLMVFQRSCDLFLGNPFNICQQAALLAMVAQQVDMDMGELVWSGGDVHLYLNHLDAIREQLSREPRPFPTLRLLRRPGSIDEYRIEDFEVAGYEPHAAIAAEVAV
ncbi:thymidylate synthase [Rhizobium sp. SYY.PMSO]|uniref:thymidylate synthase n=1 Tax=Rhizobium sp. SYY.PMSO TaxID=3382192 RepID=UPI000DE0CD72